MSNTKAFNSLFKQRLMSNKFFLYIVALAVLVMDVAVAVLSIYSGVGILHWVAPLLFAVLDLVLIAVIYFSNFRFKYSRTYPYIYMGATFVMSAVTVLAIGMQIFTILAAILFCVAHILPIIALVFSIKNSARAGKKQRTLLVLVLVVAMVVFSAVYTVITLGSGFYGQGPADFTRNLKFELNPDTDTYTVTGVLSGRGDRIVIPAERNGKPVTAIDGAIFADKSIKNVYLDCGAGVSFIANDALNNADIKLHIDKSEIDVLKNNLIDEADDHSYYIALANCVVPSGLDDDEVYITFAYSTDSIKYIQKKLIPTWFGDKGERFSLSEHADGIHYADGYDPSDEEFLYKSYQNGSKVLRGLTSGGNDINNSSIMQSCDAVPVEFDNVYAVKIESDNDTKYEISSSFKQHKNTGYRYVLASDPENLLGEVEKREGFSISWQVMVNGTKESFSELSGVLGEESTVTVYPVWSLNLPQITNLATGSADNKFIYGDDIQFSVAAQKPLSSATLNFAWYDEEGMGISTNSSYTMPNVKPEQSGSYRIKVTASAPSTSLTSEIDQYVFVQIDKRPISVVWNLPYNTEYSGTTKTISASLNSNEIINGDTVGCILDSYSVRNAGNYTVNATLQGEHSELYCIKTGDQSRSITITPFELSVTWTNDVFTYDGEYHVPVASATGTGDDSSMSIPISVSGANKNAATWTATATSQNSNYTIKENSKTHNFTINPKNITLSWDTSTGFVYNGRAQGPSVSSISGAVSGEESSIYNALKYNYATAAGSSHTASVTLNMANYKIESGSTTVYSISPKPLAVRWSGTSLTYNGQNQHVEAMLDGIVTGDTVDKSYSVNQPMYKNVGTYSVTVSISNPNYALNSNTSSSYNIVAKQITLSWSSIKSFTYDRMPHTITATPSGVISGDSVNISYTGDVSATDAGNYNITASSDNSNYVISSSTKSCSYQIVARTINVTWGQSSFTYDGQPHTVTATPSGVLSGDNVTLSYTGNTSAVNAGNYTVTASSNNGNYVISNSICPFEITRREVSFTWSANNSFVYDGNAKTYTATANGAVSGDNLGIKYVYSSGGVALSGAPKDKGTYTVTVSITNSNYELIGTVTANFTIAQESGEL